MVKRVLLLGVATAFVFSLSGCATTKKNDDLLTQGLKNKIMALESQLNEKDNEINSLKEGSVKTSEVTTETTVAKVSQVKDVPTLKQIQTALKNAGYYQGVVDGKIGKNTRQAIKDFQKANNLPVDGKVGKKTWEVLKDNLNKKTK
ncbi:MAG: peptidoglycan-binding domain-containing protein [Candidatus Omnitrophota bacterium]